jgi:hypothetical protein
MFANKIGPYANPSETYDYYVLPFCSPAIRKVQHRHKTLGELSVSSEGGRGFFFFLIFSFFRFFFFFFLFSLI